MSDTATPNLPSRDFEKTSRFYSALGFAETWRDNGWMILNRDSLTLEFFPHPELDPLTSWFSCCLRLDDLDAFYAICKEAGIPEGRKGQPRLHPPEAQSWGGRIGAFVDAGWHPGAANPELNHWHGGAALQLLLPQEPVMP